MSNHMPTDAPDLVGRFPAPPDFTRNFTVSEFDERFDELDNAPEILRCVPLMECYPDCSHCHGGALLGYRVIYDGPPPPELLPRIPFLQA